MTTICLTTEIKANIERCFDLSRDIDTHKLSAKNTNEKAIAGRTSGLCELGDTITWEAKHFGIRQKLTVEISQLDRPFYFEDRMVMGAFKRMRHEHHFEVKNGMTIMKDRFEYDVPYGIAGKLFDRFLLRKHMTNFLSTRNQVLKEIAEGK